MATMHWKCIWGAVFHLMQSVECGTLRFVNAGGDVVEVRECSTDSAIFRMFGRLEAGMKKRAASTEGAEEKIQIDLRCEPRLFDAIVKLADAQPLDFEISVVDALLLAEYLKMQGGSKKEALYRGLAQATKNDKAFRKEIEKNKNKISNINVYLLLFMREYAGAYGVEIRIEEGIVTLCYKPVEKKPRPIGKADVVSEMRVVGVAMDMIRRGGESALHILMWFADVMGMRGLYLSNCVLDADVMRCISGIRSLTKLDMRGCKLMPWCLTYIGNMLGLRELHMYNTALDKDDMDAIGCMTALAELTIFYCHTNPGDVRHLESLENLVALKIASTSKLSTEDISVIGEMKNLTRLEVDGRSMDSGSLGKLGRLRRLAELRVPVYKICKADALGIAQMESLAVLDMSYCGVEAGCLTHFRGLGIRSLDASKTRLNKDDMAGIGGMKHLTELNMYKCKIEPGSLMHLQGLENLAELSTYKVRLQAIDLAAIGEITSLKKLDIKCCKLEKGSLAHLRNLQNLVELDASWSRLDHRDMNMLGSMRSLRRLVIRYCHSTVDAEGIQYLQRLERLFDLDISGNELGASELLAISKMRCLQALSLRGCNIARGLFGNLKSLENIVALDVSWSALGIEDVAAIGKMKNLEKLYMCDCKLDAGSLLHIKDLNLVLLDVSWASLSISDMLVISRMKRLEVLNISYCSIEAGSLEHIKGAGRLKRIDITGTKNLSSGDKEAMQSLHDGGVGLSQGPFIVDE